MSLAGAEGRVVTARIVLYGPSGAGTTTMLETIARRLRADQRGPLTRQTDPTGPTAVHEVLAVELGEVRGLHPRFHLTTVPGGPAHAAARRQLLKGVDGILFVADSSPDRADATAAALQELTGHLAAYGRSLDTVPMVVVLNKRDRPDALPAEELLKRLPGRRVPVFEAVAADGRGALSALSTVARLVLARAVGGSGGQPAASPAAAPPAASARRAAPVAPAGPAGTAATVTAGGVAAAPARAGVAVGAPRATDDGLVVPLLVHDGRGGEYRLTLAVRIELSAAGGAAAAGNDPSAAPGAPAPGVASSGAQGVRSRGASS